jgi:bis(5'-nucleosidyl)-tetraphosphatase
MVISVQLSVIRRLLLPQEHSAGAVIFRRDKDQILYLVLHYEESHWGCSKGHTEAAENDEQTARREIQEETGLTDIRFIPGFQENNRYFFMKGGQRIEKSVTFLLAETRDSRITLSDEHVDSAWLPFEEAWTRITFKDEKAMFEKAQRFIQNQGIRQALAPIDEQKRADFNPPLD